MPFLIHSSCTRYYFDVDLLVVHPFVARAENKFVSVKWPWYKNDPQFFQAFVAAAPRNKIVGRSLDVMLELLNGARAKRGGGAFHSKSFLSISADERLVARSTYLV